MFTVRACLLFSFLVLHARSSPLAESQDDIEPRTPGNPIQTHDNWIMCFGAVPPAEAGWPAGRSPSSYGSNQDLCSAESPVINNVGCSCSGAYSLTSCRLPPADPVLWGARLDREHAYGWDDFDGWCRYQCWCGTEAEAARWQGYTAQQQVDATEDEISDLTGNGYISDDDLTQPPTTPLHGWGPGNTLVNDANITSVNDGRISTPNCNAKCAAGTQCHGSNCQCKVTGAQYEPSAGIIEYFASCRVYEATSATPKRGEEVPCPCNATYVSHACCDSQLDGLVWEAPELKLGEIAKSEL